MTTVDWTLSFEVPLLLLLEIRHQWCVHVHVDVPCVVIAIAIAILALVSVLGVTKRWNP